MARARISCSDRFLNCRRWATPGIITLRGALPLGLPYTLSRGGPVPRSVRVPRSLRSLGLAALGASLLALSARRAAPVGRFRTPWAPRRRARRRLSRGGPVPRSVRVPRSLRSLGLAALGASPLALSSLRASPFGLAHTPWAPKRRARR